MKIRWLILILGIFILLPLGAAACGSSNSSSGATVIVHKGTIKHTEDWKTVGNQGVLQGYESSVYGAAENLGDKIALNQYVHIIFVGPHGEQFGAKWVPLGDIEPGKTAGFKTDIFSKTTYATDYLWKVMEKPSPEVLTKPWVPQ